MDQHNYILENLNNLGELDRHDFKYLSEHVEQFYDMYSDIQINLIQRLFKLLSYDYFPNGYKLLGIHISNNEDKICLINQFKQLCYEEDNTLYITPLFTEVSGEEIYNSYKDISEKDKNYNNWKYKLYSKEMYDKCNNYNFQNQCAFSIYDGNIKNLLKAINVKHIKEIDILSEAIKCGGKKIECYLDDFYVYIDMGFIPVSICKWDDNKAPKRWINANNFKDDTWKYKSDEEFKVKRQDIVFFIYSGTNEVIDFDNWFNQIGGYSSSYDEAKHKRDLIYQEIIERNL